MTRCLLLAVAVTAAVYVSPLAGAVALAGGFVLLTRRRAVA